MTQQGNKFRVGLAFLFSVGFAIMPILALAAELNLTSDIKEFGISQQFQVDLMLDTEGEIINAIEGEVVFSKELLEIKEIRDGDSIINLWVERPSIRPTGRVIFSGIIPTGFAGVLSPYYEGYRPGKIFSLIFISKSEGEEVIDLKNGKVLLHDGLGTPAQLTVLSFKIKISREIALTPTPSVIEDSFPPESFKLEIAKDPSIFEGKWFLVFATQDKGSGIDHYEILEKGQRGSFQELIGLIWKKKWQKGESSTLLEDQNLKSHIYVKAIDKAGNERIATLPPQNLLKWYEKYWVWGIIILGVIIAYVIWRKRIITH